MRCVDNELPSFPNRSGESIETEADAFLFMCTSLNSIYTGKEKEISSQTYCPTTPPGPEHS